MSFRRVGRLAVGVLAAIVMLSCGQVYRPVVIPINTVPPNPANFHEIFGISVNVPFNQGTVQQFDVSGDSIIGAANMGVNPTHAALLPNNSRMFVVSAGSLFTGDADVVMAFTPASDSSIATGLGAPQVFSYPNVVTETSGIAGLSETGTTVTMTLTSPLNNAKLGAVVSVAGVGITGYDGNFVIASVNGSTLTYVVPSTNLASTSGGTASLLASCAYLPDFVTTAQTSNVYVANYGVENQAGCNIASTDSISQLSTQTNTMTNIAYLGANVHPVGLVETPDAQNLYVLTQGTNSVLDLSPSSLLPVTAVPSSIPVGNTPAWAVARVDGQRIYVVTQGDGFLYTIRTDTNAVVSAQPVGGAGANYVVYDKSRNRVYVTNPAAGAIYAFDATTDPPTPLTPAGSATNAISIPAPAPCATAGTCGPMMPTSIAALIDGSRFYVSSFAIATGACPDPNVSAAGCIIPQVTVFNAATLTVKTTVFPLLPSVTGATTQPYALTPAPLCTPAFPYNPSSIRFRMSAAAAVDNTRVYTSLCDAGSMAVINATTSDLSTDGNNTPDTLVNNLFAPFSAAPAGPNGQPPPQNPVLLVTGQ